MSPDAEWYIEQARKQYADDEHEFDFAFEHPDTSKVSISEDGDGAWVPGWFWVSAPEEDGDVGEAE